MKDQNIYQLVYVSISDLEFDNQDIMNLLDVAREKNSQLDITGMLIYKDGIFMQLLEGKKEVVRNVYDNTIVHDRRHSNCRVILEAEGNERLFRSWTMAYKDVHESEHKLLNNILPLFELKNQNIDFDNETIMSVLKKFRFHMSRKVAWSRF